MKMSLEIDGFDKLATLADRYPSVAERFVNQAIHNTLTDLMVDASKKAPIGVSGHLRDAWKITVDKFKGTLTSQVGYSVDIEFGTSPHAVDPKALMAWASKKGLNPYAVSKSIAKKGTKKNPFFEKALEDKKESMVKEMAEGVRNITEALNK